MNKFIADIFSIILTISHVLFTIFFLVMIFNGNVWVSLGIYDAGSRVTVTLVILLSYVFYAGLIATIISMNEYLREISKSLSEISSIAKETTQPTSLKNNRSDPPMRMAQSEENMPLSADPRAQKTFVKKPTKVTES